MTLVTDRCYIADSTMGLDEDDMHEFKSHRSICIEEIPSWCVEEIHNKLKRSRQSVSKTVCAFLNTGKGGTIYLGVLDDGTVKGIHLTTFQRDHILCSIQDLCQRFSPPIPAGMLTISFVPVCDEEGMLQKLKGSSYFSSDDDGVRFGREHSIRSSEFCWCDKDALAQFNFGILHMSYVLELAVKPWTPSEEEWTSTTIKTRLNPIYQNEEGLCYIRRQASNVQLNLQDVYEMTKNQVHNYWLPELQKIQKLIDKGPAPSTG